MRRDRWVDVSGTVVTPEGVPIASCRIDPVPHETVLMKEILIITDELGKWAVSLQDDCVYSITARDPRRELSATVEVSVKDTDVNSIQIVLGR